MLTRTILALSACAVTGLLLTGLNRDQQKRPASTWKLVQKEDFGEALFI